MAKIDLSSMTRKELEKLARDIDRAMKRVTAKELKEAKAAAEKVLKSHGFSLADLARDDASEKSPRKVAKKTANVSKPKYANPSNTSQTWTGKGRQPEWFKATIAAGKTPEDLEI